jgi:predicted N-acyltransferase
MQVRCVIVVHFLQDDTLAKQLVRFCKRDREKIEERQLEVT